MLDLKTVNLCASSNLEQQVKRPGSSITTAIKRKKNKYRDMFPASYTLVLLAVSMCGILGSDTSNYETTCLLTRRAPRRRVEK